MRIRKDGFLETLLSFILNVSWSNAVFSLPSRPTCPGFHISILALLWSPRGIRTHKRETSWRPDTGSFGSLYTCTDPIKIDTRVEDVFVAHLEVNNISLLIQLTRKNRSIHLILFHLLCSTGCSENNPSSLLGRTLLWKFLTCSCNRLVLRIIHGRASSSIQLMKLPDIKNAIIVFKM